MPSLLFEAALAIVGILSLAVATNAIYDVLKGALIKQKKPYKHIKIIEQVLPDGTHLITVDEEEE